LDLVCDSVSQNLLSLRSQDVFGFFPFSQLNYMVIIQEVSYLTVPRYSANFARLYLVLIRRDVIYMFISVCAGLFSVSLSCISIYFVLMRNHHFSPERISGEMNNNVSSSSFILSVLPHFTCPLYPPSILLHVTHSSIHLRSPWQSFRDL